MPAAIGLSDPLSLLLIVAVVVLCVTTVMMIIANSTDRARRSKPTARLGSMPVVPMITAAPARRPLPVAAHIARTTADPARQDGLAGDDRSRRAAQIEDAHRLIDHLAETNPRRLAEIITQWIHEDETTRRDGR
ncbi:MAG: hypothetical protein AB7Q42_16290 [Acidimicrobiia bacterium]